MDELRGRTGGASWVLAASLLITLDTTAATLRVRVDAAGLPVVDAVLSLHSPAAAARAARAPAASAQLDQRDYQFVPHVLPVATGTRVEFPNSDAVRHHVYSFSPAKRFELPLYGGTGAGPVQFDRAGVATLGCNIHDRMVAYVVVLDSPYFVRTGGDGIATLEAPPGEYELRVWHERLPAGALASQRVGLADVAVERQLTLPLTPAAPAAATTDARLRELQEKFRGLERGR
jgi:plastocyanin